ncbi:ATP-binding protein [Amphibacillus sediminis]|uniref:ATP-binding protein n=1 Tax=Amphibacillus sediminis TaxID=360185 RepID=UPI000836EAE2|nr:AAA family ATPase [Amphibacillus sediminis]
MKEKIHIFGASGSGTTTLGAALAKVLPHTQFDTDNYYWENKFTRKRPVPERRKILNEDLSKCKNWILSGALCGWGDYLRSYFDLVIFLWIPQDIRLERLREREFLRYGNQILPHGSKYDQFKTFIEWASLYDNAGMEVRSKTLHEHWMEELPCPVLRIEGDYSVEERVNIVLGYLNDH